MKTIMIMPTKADIERGRRLGQWLHQHQNATAVRYLTRKDAIEIKMVSGIVFTIPRKRIRWFADVEPRVMRKIGLFAFGAALEIEELDLQVSIAGMLHRLLGFDHSERGGMARTPAKVRAARLNGRKGGRPKKRVA